MNKNVGIVVVIVVAVLIVGGIYISKNSQEDSAMMEENEIVEKEGGSMIKKEDSTMKKDEDSMADKGADMITSSGSYEAYSPEKLALADSGDVVLFFRASWCPTCRALDTDIKANMQSIPAGVTILDVNYDNSTALKQKHGVTYQHTLVQVDSSGNQITKWMGSPTLASLLTNIK